MSNEAMTWARKRQIPRAAAKFVLWVMADQVAADLFFRPVEYIVDATGLDRKTVLANLARLREWGLIEDTGDRRGETGKIVVYRLRMTIDLFDDEPTVPKTEQSQKRNSPKNGTVPKLKGNSPKIGWKQSQNWDSEPKEPKDPNARSPRACAHKAPTANATPGEMVYPNGFDAGPEPTAAATPPQPTPGALACIAMREAGMPISRLNPSLPMLTQTLAAGITGLELADVVREVIARGGAPPNLPYVCRTALGRRRDAAIAQAENHASPARENRREASRQAGAKPSALQRHVAHLIARGDGGGADIAADATGVVG